VIAPPFLVQSVFISAFAFGANQAVLFANIVGC
jgi:hypothetical protein